MAKKKKSFSLAIFIFWNLCAQSFPFVMGQGKNKTKKKNSLDAPPQLINTKKIGAITIEMCFGQGTQIYVLGTIHAHVYSLYILSD